MLTDMSQPCVITIGNFDGVHCGHGAIVARAAKVARSHDAVVNALTFDPHPANVLRPGTAPPRLTSITEKQTLLKAAGATNVDILQPTTELLSLSPEAFIKSLMDRYHPIAIVEGTDFQFGTGRQGNVDTLVELGKQSDFEVIVVDSIDVALSDHQIAPVRSSFIRWLIQHGRVADATICLGRPFALSSNVEKGEQRGRTIGVPTANLSAADLAEFAIPKDGVYAGYATLDEDESFNAAISVGTKPTFNGSDRTVEVHLLDFNRDIYGQSLTVHFSRWLRDQSPFPNLESLKGQLERDIQSVRSLADNAPLSTPIREGACPETLA